MRQHRTIALLGALAALLVIPATGTTAPADQVRGPGCGDITLTDSSLAGVAAYACTEAGAATVAVYTASLYTTTTQTTLVAPPRTFTADDGTTQFPASFSLTAAPHSVCIVATSTRDNHLIDAAPNSGCFELVINFSGGGSGL